MIMMGIFEECSREMQRFMMNTADGDPFEQMDNVPTHANPNKTAAVRMKVAKTITWLPGEPTVERRG